MAKGTNDKKQQRKRHPRNGFGGQPAIMIVPSSKKQKQRKVLVGGASATRKTKNNSNEQRQQRQQQRQRQQRQQQRQQRPVYPQTNRTRGGRVSPNVDKHHRKRRAPARQYADGSGGVGLETKALERQRLLLQGKKHRKMIRSKFNKIALKRLKLQFNAIDTDNSKALDCNELLVLFNALGCKVTKRQVTTIIKDIDLGTCAVIVVV